MNATATLQRHFSEDAYLSSASQEAARPRWRLLSFGLEMGLPTSVAEASLTFDAMAQRIRDLANAWRKECAHLSSVREMVLHPAYQQIVGMGPSALPFILRELQDRPDHWFWALRAISGEDPVQPEHQGNIAQMARDWLEWAQRRGIRW